MQALQPELSTNIGLKVDPNSKEHVTDKTRPELTKKINKKRPVLAPPLIRLVPLK